jgi:hypothetical protein
MANDKIDISLYMPGDTFYPNDSGIVTTGITRKGLHGASDSPTWGNQVEVHGHTHKQAEALRDLLLGRARAFEKINEYFDHYFLVDRDRGAGDRLLMKVVAIIRETKKLEE